MTTFHVNIFFLLSIINNLKSTLSIGPSDNTNVLRYYETNDDTVSDHIFNPNFDNLTLQGGAFPSQKIYYDNNHGNFQINCNQDAVNSNNFNSLGNDEGKTMESEILCDNLPHIAEKDPEFIEYEEYLSIIGCGDPCTKNMENYTESDETNNSKSNSIELQSIKENRSDLFAQEGIKFNYKYAPYPKNDKFCSPLPNSTISVDQQCVNNLGKEERTKNTVETVDLGEENSERKTPKEPYGDVLSYNAELPTGHNILLPTMIEQLDVDYNYYNFGDLDEGIDKRRCYKKMKLCSIQNKEDIELVSFINCIPAFRTLKTPDKTFILNLNETTFMRCYEPIYNKIYQKDSALLEKEFVDYLTFLEADNFLDFNYLANIVCKERSNYYKIDLCASREKYLDFANVFVGCFIPYPVNYDSNDIYNDLIYQFCQFNTWIETKYKIKEIKGNRNAEKHYRRYIKKLQGLFPMYSVNIWDLFRGIYKSKNYNFFLKAFPCFNLLNTINYPEGYKPKYTPTIKYLQLILCNIEAFRYKYFKQNTIEEEELEILQSNPEFNEMLAVTCYIIQKILLLNYGKSETINVLKLYNFIFFIKSKHFCLFDKLPTVKELMSVFPFNNDYVLSTWNNLDSLIELKFTDAFKMSKLCGKINKLFN